LQSGERSSETSLIDDNKGCLSKINQPFFLRDGLGFLCFHVGDDREQAKPPFFREPIKYCEKRAPSEIVAGGESPESHLTFDEIAGAAGGKPSLAISWRSPPRRMQRPAP
jgi:hypothetical protein